jgi:hypothetical protein
MTYSSRRLFFLPLIALLLFIVGCGNRTTCPECGKGFNPEKHPAGFVAAGLAGAATGGAAGAVGGAYAGAGTGVVAGPAGGASGAVVFGAVGAAGGAVIGGGAGLWAYDSFVKCPKCGEIFKKN